jgi:DNA-binding NarL/FixJ family response regulator
MKYVIVDDDPAYRESRQRWLLNPPACQRKQPERPDVESCDALTFEEALTMGSQWRDYDVAVVDGYDRRTEQKRQDSAALAGIPYRGYQRLPGVDVVAAAKEHHPSILVIVTSTYVKINTYLAKAMYGAGAEYVFSHDEVAEPADFIDKICLPHLYARRRSPTREERRLAQVPRLLADADPAARRQALGATAKQIRGGSRRATDRLIDQLREALSLPDYGGPHRTHRQRVVPRLRELLGLDHETFDASGGDSYP